MLGAFTPVTVLLVDDHAVVREGYRRLLERQGDILVVGEAGEAKDAERLIDELDPQIVVLDITLPGTSGIDVMKRMLSLKPRTRWLIFSMHEEAIFAKHALQEGACGYVTKASAPDVLVEAVHAIADGRKYVCPTMAERLALKRTGPPRSAKADLSAREIEVLRLLVRGYSIKDIAKSLELTPKTVANHQSSIRHKLGAETALELLSKASQLGL